MLLLLLLPGFLCKAGCKADGDFATWKEVLALLPDDPAALPPAITLQVGCAAQLHAHQPGQQLAASELEHRHVCLRQPQLAHCRYAPCWLIVKLHVTASADSACAWHVAVRRCRRPVVTCLPYTHPAACTMQQQ
jgi:hypothetical protein